MGDGRAERSSTIGDGGQAVILLMTDTDGSVSGSLLDLVLPTFLLPDILGLKQRALQCSIQYSTVKYTKAQPPVEDAHA